MAEQAFAKFVNAVDNLAKAAHAACAPEAAWVPADMVPTSNPNYRDLQRRGLI